MTYQIVIEPTAEREISKFDPRALVVWATSVTSARSCKPAGTLKATQGRTFPVIPRSTSQTSPRLAAGIRPFLGVEQAE